MKKYAIWYVVHECLVWHVFDFDSISDIRKLVLSIH